MILSKYALVKISSSNVKYWKSKGYTTGPAGGRAGKNNGHRIRVKISDLQSGSNVNVSCQCDKCGSKYIQIFCRNTDICYQCRKIIQMKGNKNGCVNKGRVIPSMRGENHPRFNPNRKELLQYGSQVRWLTEINYNKNRHIINPLNYPRGRCGVPGAYQLDHIKSVKQCFEEGMSPEQAASVDNLQMLSWEANREKWS